LRPPCRIHWSLGSSSDVFGKSVNYFWHLAITSSPNPPEIST
jgi:hypothetical protein